MEKHPKYDLSRYMTELVLREGLAEPSVRMDQREALLMYFDEYWMPRKPGDKPPSYGPLGLYKHLDWLAEKADEYARDFEEILCQKLAGYIRRFQIETICSPRYIRLPREVARLLPESVYGIQISTSSGLDVPALVSDPEIGRFMYLEEFDGKHT